MEYFDSINRFKGLKEATLLKYCSEIDLESEVDLYDTLLEHLANGDLNDEVINTFPILGNDKEDIVNIVNEHIDILFRDGDINKWNESVIRVPIVDCDVIMTRILDNYNFLLDLCFKGGKDVIDELEKYKNMSYFTQTSIVEELRCVFGDDNMLSYILVVMANDNSIYNLFTDDQKGCLLKYSLGTLYYYDENTSKLINPFSLAMEICNRSSSQKYIIGDLNNNITGDLIKYFKGFNDFENIISDMALEYYNKTDNNMNIKVREYKDLFNDLFNNYYIKEWSINKN